jgi:hypothetical protein
MSIARNPPLWKIHGLDVYDFASLNSRAEDEAALTRASLPITDVFVPLETSDQHLAEAVSTLGYPGFRYLRPHTAKNTLTSSC